MPKPDDTEDDKSQSDTQKVQSAVEMANAKDEEDKTEEETDDTDDSEEEGADDKGDDSEEDDSEEENSDDDDSEEEEKPEKKGSVERKFKNLADDDDKAYISNIEKAYEESSAEAIRLDTELKTSARRFDAIMQAAAKDPDLAGRLTKAIDEATGGSSSGTDDSKGSDAPKPTDNPFLVDAQQQWREKSAKEVEAIVEANPEIVSDPKINSQVKHWMEVFSNEEYRANKRLMSGGEAMEAAMQHLGIKDKRTKQEIASASKDLAAPTRPQGTRKPKPSSGKNVSDAAYRFGEMMGVSREKVEKYAQK